MWLPAFGAALFFTAGLVWAATPTPVVEAVAADAGTDAPADADDAAPEAAPSAAPVYVNVPAVEASAAPSPPPRMIPPQKLPRPRPKADGGH
jgi:hypothetical protein